MRKKRVHIFQRSISVFLKHWLVSFLSLNSLSKSLVFMVTKQSTTLSFLPHQHHKIFNTRTFLIFFDLSVRYHLSRLGMLIRFILISKNSPNLLNFKCHLLRLLNSFRNILLTNLIHLRFKRLINTIFIGQLLQSINIVFIATSIHNNIPS